jgi:hypothetical protein
MSCLRYSQPVTTACRNAQPGVTKMFIANYADVTSYAVDTAGTSITGITMSGSTKFYPIALNKQVASLIDTPTINLVNGVSLSKPKVSFKVQGLTATSIQMYKELLQADVIVVIKTIDGTLYGVGFANGLSMSAGTLGTEAANDGFLGLSAELDGVESSPFFIIGAAVNFESALVA